MGLIGSGSARPAHRPVRRSVLDRPRPRPPRGGRVRGDHRTRRGATALHRAPGDPAGGDDRREPAQRRDPGRLPRHRQLTCRVPAAVRHRVLHRGPSDQAGARRRGRGRTARRARARLVPQPHAARPHRAGGGGEPGSRSPSRRQPEDDLDAGVGHRRRRRHHRDDPDRRHRRIGRQPQQSRARNHSCGHSPRR